MRMKIFKLCFAVLQNKRYRLKNKKKSTLLFFMRVDVKATAIPAKKVAQFPIDKNLRDAATSSDSSS